jgi:NAD(P)H-flavin reductase
MFELVRKTQIAENTFRVSINAPHIAAKRKAGQFVIVVPTEDGERVPLTILSSDAEEGTIDIVFLVIGASTRELSKIEVGRVVPHVAGPLGSPTEIAKVGTVVVVGGGVGAAAALPIAVANRNAGNRLISIVGARDAEHFILEEEFQATSDTFIPCTDDGSHGKKGFVTDALRDLIESGEEINEVVAVGPLVMMRAVAELTRPHGIKTIVSLNPIMVDGTGMCGGCRVTVGGKTYFACVDGPEFDGHEVDFAELSARLGTYKEDEQCRLDAALAESRRDQLPK